MSTLPASPDLDYLKKQAKELLRDALAGDSSAIQRFLQSLPAARGLTHPELVHRNLKLHDAQSVLAREYGFRSWIELSRFVTWKRADRTERLKSWADWVYRGLARERRFAVRMLRQEAELFSAAAREQEPWIACATGDAAALITLLNAPNGTQWVNQPVSPLQIPPLIAVTHSQLVHENGFASGMVACLALLLEHGADPNARWTNPEFPDWPLSALYGAVGRAHNAEMTRLLLEAGANPNDNESLYHSCESPDPKCTQLLLEAGATVNGSNALGHILDFDKPEVLQLLIDHRGDVNETPRLHGAILRGRSLQYVRILVNAGADLRALNHEGVSLFRFAQLHGREDVLAILREAGISEELTVEESFIAAAARADEDAASAILAGDPGILSRLTELQLQMMPQMAAVGQIAPVRTMLNLGWPREVRFGWGATALNHAVMRGDPEMAELLLHSGADWRTTHNFNNDNVLGTLSWASGNARESSEAGEGDYAGCAQILVQHGIPLDAFEGYTFAPEVEEVLDQARLRYVPAEELSDHPK